MGKVMSMRTWIVFFSFVICNIVLFLCYSNPTATFKNSVTKTYHSSTVEVKIKKNWKLIVLVLSVLNGKTRRDAIRETWMKKYRENVSDVFVKFSIGTDGLSSQDMKKLTLEDATYDDLLLLPHLHDSYNNLTRKVLQSFVALDKLYNSTYLLKCDEDSFVNMDAILRLLNQRRSNQKYYWGYFFKNAEVLMTGKWRETKWFLCNTYLPYAAGGGYILSHDLVRLLAVNSDNLILYNCEDISVGTWLSPFDIERHHDERFRTSKVLSTTCSSNLLVRSENSVKNMFAIQASLDNGHGILCPSGK